MLAAMLAAGYCGAYTVDDLFKKIKIEKKYNAPLDINALMDPEFKKENNFHMTSTPNDAKVWAGMFGLATLIFGGCAAAAACKQYA